MTDIEYEGLVAQLSSSPALLLRAEKRSLEREVLHHSTT